MEISEFHKWNRYFLHFSRFRNSIAMKPLRQRLARSKVVKVLNHRKPGKVDVTEDESSQDLCDLEFSISSSCMTSEKSISLPPTPRSGRRRSSVRFDVSPSSRSTSVEPTPRPCLKKFTLNLEELAKLSVFEKERSDFIHILQEGAILTKIYSSGEQSKKFFFVSKDGSELKYVSMEASASNRSESRVTLAAIRGVRFGIAKFGQVYDWENGSPENCFSIVLSRERRIDVECPSKEVMVKWFLGLQILCPMSHKNISRAQLNWRRAQYKSVKMAKEQGVSENELWRNLVCKAKSF